jgi:hypothetical protein
MVDLIITRKILFRAEKTFSSMTALNSFDLRGASQKVAARSSGYLKSLVS